MSERLAPTEIEESGDEQVTEEWLTGDHYSLMKVDAGVLGNAFYYSLPTLTILATTKEELDEIHSDFSALFTKYTDGIIVGSSHEASLILSLNQAASDLSSNGDIIRVLREKIFELTGSYDDAGNWEDIQEGNAG